MHNEQLAEHGRSDCIRDETLLDSAPAKPLKVFAASRSTGRLPDCSALCRWHCTEPCPLTATSVRSCSFHHLSGRVWLGYHCHERRSLTVLRLADGSLGEEEVATWVRQPCCPSGSYYPTRERSEEKQTLAPFSNLFRHKERLTNVVSCDSLGTCAFECPDLL
jgi:death on curing protein